MYILPELVNEIAKHKDNLNSFSSVCQLWHDIATPHIKIKYMNYFDIDIPQIVLDAFGGKEALQNYHVLKIDNCSDYIDFVNLKMMTTSIMYGIDPYQRRFYCVRYHDLTVKNVKKSKIFS